MKSMFILLLALAALISPYKVSAQDDSPNLLDSIELQFSLDGEPSPESVGFDNPKSNWYLQYELVLTDSAELEKLERCRFNEGRQFDCSTRSDKNLDKKIRKTSLAVSKGEFPKRNLLAESNRQYIIPIQLSGQMIGIFNEAATVFEKNPTFVLFIKTRVSTKNTSGAKLKKKLSFSRVYPLKTYAFQNEKKFEFWNIKSFGISFAVYKADDGSLRLGGH